MANESGLGDLGGAVLVDTSIWIDHLRGRTGAHVAELHRLLLRRHTVVTAPPVLQEILQGAKTREAFAALKAQFTSIRCVAPVNDIAAATESARLFLECRLRGNTPRSSNDCLIACIAVEHGLALLHNDRDFEAIAAVEPRLRLYRTGHA